MRYITLCFLVVCSFFWSFKLTSAEERKLVLEEFSVTQSGNKTDIKWTLNREPFGTYFTVEKSTDGKNFTKIVDQPVAENGNIFEEYFETDYQPYKGVSFYRIRQTDETGNVYYSEVVCFKYSEDQSRYMASSLPKDNAILAAVLENTLGRPNLFVLRDSDGNDHYSRMSLGREDTYLFASKSDPELPAGIYRVVGCTNDQLYNLKVVIK